MPIFVQRVRRRRYSFSLPLHYISIRNYVFIRNCWICRKRTTMKCNVGLYFGRTWIWSTECLLDAFIVAWTHTHTLARVLVSWRERIASFAFVCRPLPCLRFIYIAHKFSFHLFPSTVPDLPSRSVRFLNFDIFRFVSKKCIRLT